MINNIVTWQTRQGAERFVHTPEMKDSLCYCLNTFDSQWIAQRLNLAAELEKLAYNFTMNDDNGDKIREFVKNKLKNM